MILPDDVIEARMEFAEKVGYDEYKCSAEWGIARPATRNFIRLHKKSPERIIPEWENRWVADLQALTRKEYTEKYGIDSNTYAIRLCDANREHGDIATPEVRARWMKEYWEGL